MPPELLNVGCGTHFSAEWTNLDLRPAPGVVGHDLRRPLPYEHATFDAVYSSHVLEHLAPRDGARLVAEMHRVLRSGGTVRVAVPDLERICRAYLERLSEALDDPSDDRLGRYRWSVLELVDQMVRQEPGGEMIRAIREGSIDADYVEARCGEEFAPYLSSPGEPPPPRSRIRPREVPAAVWRRLRAATGRPPDPRRTGEAHRWMYDRLSLRLLLERTGFEASREVAHDESAIPGWERYRLDTSADGKRPRKPDSLFIEARRP